MNMHHIYISFYFFCIGTNCWIADCRLLMGLLLCMDYRIACWPDGLPGLLDCQDCWIATHTVCTYARVPG